LEAVDTADVATEARCLGHPGRRIVEDRIYQTKETHAFALVLDGAPNHRCGDLVVPANIMLLYLPPYSPELNPKENLWDEIREKIFKNYALKSMDAVCAKLKQAVLHIERNPKLVRSITAFPYIVNSL
jgi:transposase